MPHTLKNENLEVHIDLPEENYNFSRFDWTGKITAVKFRGIPVSTIEKTECENEHHFGKAFYNEFGIDSPLGFEETEIGGWFHKIGIGLLRKEAEAYLFSDTYAIKPAQFRATTASDKVSINCMPEAVNGYSYHLKKVITLLENGFKIQYHLLNTGSKKIVTDEYVHNFTAIANHLIGTDYELGFSFPLAIEHFDSVVNPEQIVEIHPKRVKFKGRPQEQFFYSNLSGNERIPAKWELVNVNTGIGIRETGNFETNKVNLWGWKHVISPELFFTINLRPFEAAEWSRTYDFYRVF